MHNTIKGSENGFDNIQYKVIIQPKYPSDYMCFMQKQYKELFLDTPKKTMKPEEHYIFSCCCKTSNVIRVLAERPGTRSNREGIPCLALTHSNPAKTKGVNHFSTGTIAVARTDQIK